MNVPIVPKPVLLHGEALIARDSPRVSRALQQGLASREHATFVRRLECTRRRQG